MSAIKILKLEAFTDRIKKSKEQAQTRDCFSYKWKQRSSYESEEFLNKNRKWLIERYCQGDQKNLEIFLGDGPKMILDAGCGSGFSSALLFGKHLNHHHFLGIDISDATEVAKSRFHEMGIKAEFLQCGITELPVPEESFDLIFSEGVLHHTDSTFESLKHLSHQLKKGGHFMFYVYKKKALIREFTDDAIRQQLQELSDEEAWEALKPLTKLGMALGEMNIEVNVPEDVPLLGIPKGKIDLQRFIYWNIFKAFHHPGYSEDENNHMNFDWYRPLNCHRHSENEIRDFCQKCSLNIKHIDIQESGITVVATKQ
jgi:SAM-dependent methyltransferase